MIISEYTIKGAQFQSTHLEPALYLAATPIGNLRDITLRVLDAIAACDLIACEDTRVTGKLLNHFGIKKKMISYHEHNANSVGPSLLENVKNGNSVVLVSDAGTPLVSDPGFRLVETAKTQGVKVIPLPGASAPLAGLIASGLPSETWTFVGFLPNKSNARISALKEYERHQSTLIFFESPNRLNKCLVDMRDVFGAERHACVARELTKLHEEIFTASLSDLVEEFEPRNVKGEVVIIVAPDTAPVEIDTTQLLTTLLETLPLKQAAAEAANVTGKSKRDLYQLALSLKDT